MAAQPWSTVVQQWKLVEDTSTDAGAGLYGRIDRDAARTLIGVSSETDCDVKCTQMLGRMANFYRQTLLLRFQKSYPNTAKDFLSLQALRLQEYRGMRSSLLNAAGVSELSIDWLLDSTSANIGVPALGTSSTLYYITADDPVNGTSGTYAGTAENGAFLVKEPVEALYINRGTKSSPTWVQWSTTSLIDYILNPTELLECGYLRTIFYMKGYGTIIDISNFSERLRDMPTAQKLSLQEAMEAENLALSIIQVDPSADGLLSDQEVRATTNRRYFF